MFIFIENFFGKVNFYLFRSNIKKFESLKLLNLVKLSKVANFEIRNGINYVYKLFT